MKHFLWFCAALFLFAVPFAADAQFPSQPKSRTNGVAQNTAAPLPTPAPQKIEVAPPVVNVSPPNVTVAPQLVAPTPTFMDEIKTWLNTIFAGLITVLLAKIGFRPAAPVAGGTGGLPAAVSVLEKVKARISDPDTRAGIDGLILQAVQSGIPGMAVQTGLSMVPGVGPVASRLEPLIRQKVIEALQERAGGLPADVARPVTPDIGNALDALRGIIESRLPPRP